LKDEREGVIASQRKLSLFMQKATELERRRRQIGIEHERQAQEELRRMASEAASVERGVKVAEARLEEMQRELAVLETEYVNITKQENELNNLLHSLNAELEELRVKNLQENSGEVSLEEQIKLIEQEIKQGDVERNNIRVRLANVSNEYESVRRVISALERDSASAKLSIEKINLELNMKLEEIQKSYGDEVTLPTVEVAEEIKGRCNGEWEEFGQSLRSSVNQLQQRLNREGEVDPESIELHKVEAERLVDMQKQYADLTSASKLLDETIRHLQEVSKKRFLETFLDVKEKFSELIPRLFGGGSGLLELTNPDDPLNSGVEISVRPPGKKVRSMEVLSGGEKALSAAAILIAMFLHHPSPICVLDEVDAPLDDANVDRFLSLINEISETTQFLVITHNKQSMNFAGRLIGITMQEQGVSKALSVSFEETKDAIERLAANM